ncbi:DUF3618 domain-containing protein [Actinomadura madurae]|uniref:DUF3618 domain-containing protein n=1 Tax=Actinomadura madurae TaxID=1993 RepID=UPI0020D23E98|nr:DUF3618 domain-containing protein [Actinomadura madurae]MCQ0011675.1 DUF3618 domain-containing protein [Actinomadura madurae]
MTTQGKHGAAAGTEELRQDVDRARHELGDTVEQLAAKADVRAMARQKAEYARGRARDAAASAWRAAGSEKTVSRARRGGIAIGSAGAVAGAALWMRRRGTPRMRLRGTPRMRLGRGRRAPVQVRFRTGQKRAIEVRRRRRKFF